MQHIIIYSHGFGVRKDDRGLFTDITAGLPNAEHVLFDYNEVDEVNNTLTVKSLDEQAEALQKVITKTKEANPDATIDLIAHSQGCVVAAIACPEGLRSSIFLASTSVVDVQDKIERWRTRLGATLNPFGVTELERSDGSVTIIPPEYWTSMKNRDAQALYNQFADHTNLTIITATQDEILGEVVFDRLAPTVEVIEMPTGHNFEGSDRDDLVALLASRLQ